jgi:methanogenic corrinoid protein MtbC1
MADRAGFRVALDDALERYDRETAITLAHAALDDGTLELPQLYDVLAQTLVDVGAAWQTGTAEVWQEHLVTGIVRTLVESCALRVAAAAPDAPGASIVLAAPDDEYHDLGLRMLTDRFTLAGWRAHFLGANVPVAQVVTAVREVGADAVALSASTHFHRVRLRTYVTTVTKELPDLRVWVGGPAFVHGNGGWPEELMLDPRSIPPGGER